MNAALPGRWVTVALAAILVATPGCTAGALGGPATAHRPADGRPPASARQARLRWSRVDPVAHGVSQGQDPVAGFHVYSGRSPDRLRRVATIRDTSATQYVVTRLPRGTWYFTVSTFTRRGVESELPPPVSKTVH